MNQVLEGEIKKTRPAVVISNNIQNKITNRIIVIPITSNVTDIFPFEAKILINNKFAKVVADQIMTVGGSRLGNFISQVNKTELKDIERAVKVALSLD